MVKVTRSVFARPLTKVAVEPGLTRTSPSSVLDNYRFIKVLVQLEVLLSLFHKLRWLGEFFLGLSRAFTFKRSHTLVQATKLNTELLTFLHELLVLLHSLLLLFILFLCFLCKLLLIPLATKPRF